MNVEQNPSPALPCAVVRDLLPLYLEGLTSPQTDRWKLIWNSVPTAPNTKRP